MSLQFMSESTLQDLRGNYDNYKDAYHTKNDEWFQRYFSEDGRVIQSNVPFEMPQLSHHSDYVLSDKENVKRLYEALKHLTPAQATEERVWSGLAHLQFRDYVYYRLEKEIATKKDQRINTAMFFKNGKRRSLFVHILARLWWVGYMTYDPTNKENPYWLTEFFCEKDFSARAVVFFSSSFTANKDITLGVLRAIYRLHEQGHDIKRAHFVEANKYLNIVGGAMILDMLTTEEVEEMATKQLKKVFGIAEEVVVAN